MKAPACGMADGRPFLSNTSESTGLRIYNVRTVGLSFPLGAPLALTNAGRAKTPGCPAYLSSASNCANTAVANAMGATGPGAQQWVLQDAGMSADGTQLVVIYTTVRGRAGRWRAAGWPSCWLPYRLAWHGGSSSQQQLT